MTPKIAFEMSVTNDVMMQVWQAKSDLVLTSPYMIPGETGMQSFRNLERDKVKVTVITNSLAPPTNRSSTPAIRAIGPDAEGRRRSLRAEPDAGADHQAPRRLRQVARPPAREDGGHRQEGSSSSAR
jgi:phosphatidylserine/phosphatidylglycerophosphate/cardiolipin synthase-like enzyme